MKNENSNSNSSVTAAADMLDYVRSGAMMVTDPEAADEATSRVALRHVQKFGSAPVPFNKSQLRSHGRNEAFDNARSKARTCRLATGYGRERALLTEPACESSIETLELCAAVRRMLAKLPIDWRTVLELRYWNGMSFEQIATATGASVGTVHGRHARGLVLLKETLEKLGEI